MLNHGQNQRYITGIDGLRALAVLAVFAYHFGFSWAKGGFLGVDVFFVISDYLITSQIVSRLENDDFSLREFWMKRIRRLLPAAYVMILTVLLWVWVFHRQMFSTILGDGISSIFYTSNWWFIYHKLSYFDSFGSPSPFKNLWSLAIEEQFYITWPLIVIIGLKILKKKKRFASMVLIAAVCSAVLMAIMYQPGMDVSRVYYGTDTRAFALLLGGWLAMVYPMHSSLSVNQSVRLGITLNLVSGISLALLLVSVIFINEFQEFLYRGGMLLISLNAAVLIACVSHPGCFLGQLLSWKPLSWIGKRSYSIYLWHYPVIVLSTPVYEIGHPVYWRVFAQFAIVLILAELSYRFIETPIRQYGFKGYFTTYIPIQQFFWKKIPIARLTSLIIVPSIIVFVILGCTMAAIGEQMVAKVQTSTVVAEEKKEEQPPSSASQSKSYNKILAIGDSIMLDIYRELNNRFSNIIIDGKVGRHLYQAIDLAPAYADYNADGSAVIIELGTNSYFTDKQIDSLLRAFSKAQIYLVNVRVPRQWEKEVNATLARKAQENENITLVDWYSTAIHHPEYFEKDGVHLKPKGAEALTALIEQALLQNKK